MAIADVYLLVQDSYTDGGRQDGGTLPAPVITPPDVEAGRRSTDGKVWVEDIADDIANVPARLQQSGACTDLSLWPSAIKQVDFIGQMTAFLNQSNDPDPESTLCAVLFGINDFENSKSAPSSRCSSHPDLNSPARGRTDQRALLLYGRGTHTPAGDAFVQTVFFGLHDLHLGINSTGHGETEGAGPQLNVAFAEFSRIWGGVLGADPGFEVFGYVSTDACTDCSDVFCSTEGMCDDRSVSSGIFLGEWASSSSSSL
ncbi:hypothetical protein OH76DRAFT_1480868 [Lentinus brumalis]|uniref:Uncharacterized protein n=1 Tax=Lentinus brumalis TaxID=2498619 RepID=A0A371DID7_9APHY|nr:hypothetical protein OH76DRAFT_1480868 [Polyporus brumalis]